MMGIMELYRRLVGWSGPALSWPAFSGRRGTSTPQAKTLDRDQALILKRSLLNPERSNIRKDYFRTSNDRF